MDEEKLKKLYFICRKLGYAYNQEIGQDFPAWAVDCVIRNGFKSPKYLLIDYLRNKFGRKGASKKTKTMRERLRGLRSGENVEDYDRTYFKFSLENQLDHNDMMDLLVPKDRIIRILHDKYGLNKTEIAYVFGLSLTNISQHLKKSTRILKTIVRCDTRF